MPVKQVLVKLGESDDAALILVKKDIKVRTGVQISDSEAFRAALREKAAKVVDHQQTSEAVPNESE